jgi:hypothetical protein
VQIEVSNEDAEILSDCIEMLIHQYEHAKEHTLSCPSVTTAEMLTDVMADYDERLAALHRIELELGSASV